MKDMSNDPRLTAYALGELDEKDRREVEAMVASSAEARREVDGIAELAGQLGAAMAGESPAQAAVVGRNQNWMTRPLFRLGRWGKMAAAACVLIAAGLTVSFVSLPHRSRTGSASSRVQTHNLRGVGQPMTIYQQPKALGQASVSESAAPPGEYDAANRLNWNAVRHANATPKEFITPSTTDPLESLLQLDPRGFDADDSEAISKLAGVACETAPVIPSTEAYDHIEDNAFLQVANQPLSTFSIDVDTASYANVRRFINGGSLPPKGAVRIEEMINYFAYDDAPPTEGSAFAVRIETASCPWTPAHRLARINLKGRVIDAGKRPACNLVFLIDVSGSMQDANKLALLQQALPLLVDRLTDIDRVAIVVYAGNSGLVLPSTTANNKETIRQAITNLSAGGSTNGGEGIVLAYKTAREHFIAGGVNRVVLATDGDFNVGVTSQDELIQLIQKEASGGVFLSVLGVGMGNYKDSTLEKLADKGNGNYAYIDTLNEARKVLVEQADGTLVTIAKDVKIQIEFNPAKVGAYRLIGYENRILAAEDFNNDKKDAGEIGAGHSVTALYEIVPTGTPIGTPAVNPLKYQTTAQPTGLSSSGEMMTVKLRYKAPDAQTSQLIEQDVSDIGGEFANASTDLRFAAAVAGFGMALRESPHKGSWGLANIEDAAVGALGEDAQGYRREFVELVRKAKSLSR
jgi:Ca-activated chloride channel family protein